MEKTSPSELVALIDRQSGSAGNPALWCPPSPIKDPDTYVPDGAGGCARCGHTVAEHSVGGA